MDSRYEAYSTDVRLGEGGYWVVTLSLAPDLRCEVMIADRGLAAGNAAKLAVSGIAPKIVRRQSR